MGYIFKVLIFFCGTIAGSFLNMYIDKVLNKENRMKRRSHCICCGNVLKSWQYPAVCLFHGILWEWIYSIYGLHLESVVFALCASVLIVIAVIDFKTYEIPFECNVVIALLGVVRLISHLSDWKNYVIGLQLLKMEIL